MAEDVTARLAVEACGDCHLMNFAFATPEENILFDINDFDETLAGVDFTVDIKRLAASVAVAALAEGFSNKRQKQLRLKQLKPTERVCAPWLKLRAFNALREALA